MAFSMSGILPNASVFTPKYTEVLGQGLSPDDLKDVPSVLNRTNMGGGNYGRNYVEPYVQVNPEYQQYAVGEIGNKSNSGRILGYRIPTGKTYQGKPLIAEYDAQGNLEYVTIPPDQFLQPDPSRPNIISQPKFNKTGGIVDYGIGDTSRSGGGGFGEFLGEFVSDVAPMILAGFGANYLAGNLGGAGSLFGGSTAAGGATAAGLGASTNTGLTLGSGGLGLSAGGGTLGITTGVGAGSIGGTLGQTLSGITTGVGTGAALGGLEAASGTGLLSSGTGLTTGGSGLGLTSGGGVGLTAGSTGAGSIGAGLGETLAAIDTGILSSAAAGAAAGAGTGITSDVLSAISKATGIEVDTLNKLAPSVIQGLIGAGGSYLASQQAKEAAQTQADAQIRAAQIAADAARFRPVGVTTRFGSSNFQTDAAGNVIGAGYTPSAEITGYQNQLSGLAGQGINDVIGARAAYQPLTGAAQNLFNLGQGYLAKTPEQAAQDYIAKQQALLAPSQENQLAQLQNKLFQQGRGGAATAQGGNLMATSPELAAYYNSLAQSNLVLAANADQEARNRITYGAGLFDTGANLQGKYYTGQTAAYAPFTTAMDTSSGLERLAQQPLDLSTSIGQKVSTANANVGSLTGQGIINAAGTMAPANAYSGAGNALTGLSQSPVFTNAINNAFGVQPQQTTSDVEKLRLFNRIFGT